jgi:hypothetical protein
VRYSAGFLSFGVATAVGSASAGFVSLMESLSIAYGTRDSRSYWYKHTIAAGVTLLAAVFALATFGLMVFGHRRAPGRNNFVEHISDGVGSRAVGIHLCADVSWNQPGEFSVARRQTPLALADCRDGFRRTHACGFVHRIQSVLQALFFLS